MIENEPPVPAYVVRDAQMPEVTDLVAKANKKLARAGLAERFDVVEDERFEDQTVFGVTWVRFRLSTPVVRLGDWMVLGAVDPIVDPDDPTHVEYITRMAQGSPEGVLRDYQVVDHHCDHCHRSRRRTTVFLLTSRETGQIVQVGNSCLSLFTGVTVTGLRSLMFADDLEKDMGALMGGPSCAHDPGQWRVSQIVAVALALSDGGMAYRAKNLDGTGTSRQVKDYVACGSWEKYFEKTAEYDVPSRRPDDYLGDGTVALVVASMAAMDEDSEYADTMRTLARRDWVVPAKLVGVTASAVAVWARTQKTTTRPLAPTGFFGEVGARYTQVEATLTRSTYIGGGFGYHSPDRYMYTLVTAEGDHALVWWTDELSASFRIGDTVLVDFTVKSHDTWRPGEGDPRDQTTIYFVKRKTLVDVTAQARSDHAMRAVEAAVDAVAHAGDDTPLDENAVDGFYLGAQVGRLLALARRAYDDAPHGWDLDATWEQCRRDAWALRRRVEEAAPAPTTVGA